MIDYSRYPDDWKTAIRPRILERANNCCEWCHAPNHSQRVNNNGKLIRVVLTIAHIGNPDPLDCRDENLAALCQKCHLTHDAALHARHAAETRRRKHEAATGQLSMFEVEI